MGHKEKMGRLKEFEKEWEPTARKKA